jgi:hypothetical protein
LFLSVIGSFPLELAVEDIASNDETARLTIGFSPVDDEMFVSCTLGAGVFVDLLLVFIFSLGL